MTDFLYGYNAGSLYNKSLWKGRRSSSKDPMYRTEQPTVITELTLFKSDM